MYVSIWKHNKSFKGKLFNGKYGYLKGDRVFQLVPIEGTGKIKSFESPQEAKSKGYLKIK